MADFLAMRYPDVTGEGTLKNRTSVCAGYANLFKSLCEAAGLKAVYVSIIHYKLTDQLAVIVYQVLLLTISPADFWIQ